MKTLVSLMALVGAATATTMIATPAEACGGCFVQQSENTVVTGHRMALSISLDRTVLWDQIQYAGDPSEFSWVLPVKQGATIEIATDAWFDVLEAGTATAVSSPRVSCGGGSNGGGFGCGDSDFAALADGGSTAGGNNGVTVVSKGTVGPYDTVTLSAENPAALNEWLTDNGYEVPADIQPVIDEYVEENFDFIALKLQPGANVSQMKPVRVITPGSSFTLPLRMVAAGTGAETAVTLFVIGEGRYEPANFPSDVVSPSNVLWDFNSQSSNYSEVRLGVMAKENGRTWITTAAKDHGLLGPQRSNDFGGFVSYSIGDGFTQTLGGAYMLQGELNAEGSCEGDAIANLESYNESGGVVVEQVCNEQGECEPLGSGEIAASELACDGLDDLAVALTGMHPRDVWLTRVEANLPRDAFDEDLQMQAAEQTRVENRFTAGDHIGSPCGDVDVTSSSGFSLRNVPGGIVSLGLFGLGLAFLARRRRHGDAAS